MANARTAEEQEAFNEQLLHAARAANVPAIKQAIEDGAEVNARDSDQYTPLHHAALYKNTSPMIALLEAGAETDALTKNQYTPLHFASGGNNMKAARILLAAGADLTLKNQFNDTPIDNARDCDHFDLTTYLHSIADDQTKRPTPESVGLDMNKRNEALAALARGERPVVGKHTATLNASMDRQRQAALNDPSEGI